MKRAMIHLGALIPATNITVEPELYSFIVTERGLSGNIAIHFARIDFTTPYLQNNKKFLAELYENSQTAISRLRTIPLKALGFFCTSATEIHNSKEHKEILTIQETDLPLVTSANAIISACVAVNINNALLITPYNKIVGKDISHLLHRYNIDTKKECHLNLKTSQELQQFGFTSLANTVRENFRSGLDGIIISCTNLPTFHIIHFLEKEFKIPIISSNQATLWKMLNQLSIDVPISGEFGSLFQMKTFRNKP